MTAVTSSFRCPVCGTTSRHPEDVWHGYCGACHAFTGVHVSRIAAGSAPGGFYSRVATVSGHLLDAHPVTTENAGRSGLDDDALADAWLEEHPDDEVHVYIYDGDSGDCVSTIVVKR